METFILPFCPNGDCPEHGQALGQAYVDYISWGGYSTLAFGLRFMTGGTYAWN